MSSEKISVARSNRTAGHKNWLLTGALAAALFAGGCGTETLQGEATAASATSTAATEPTVTPTPSTTTSKSTAPTTTVPRLPSISTEITAKPTLCDMDVSAILPGAACHDVTAEGDSYFSTVLEAAEFRSTAGAATVKVIADKGEFQYPAKYNAQSVQFEERTAYGLANFNTLCGKTACYALDTHPDTSEVPGPLVYEAASPSRDQNLRLLGLVAASDIY